MKPKVFIDANFKVLNSKILFLRNGNTFRPMELNRYVVRLHNMGSLDAMSVKLFCKYVDIDVFENPIDEMNIGIIRNKSPVVKVFHFPVTKRSISTLKRLELSVTYEDKLSHMNCKSIREYDIITNPDGMKVPDGNYSQYNYLNPISETVITYDTPYRRLTKWVKSRIIRRGKNA